MTPDPSIYDLAEAALAKDELHERFVLLWVWLAQNVAACENELAAARLSHASVEHFEPSASRPLPEGRAELTKAILGWVGRIDDQLAGRPPRTAASYKPWPCLKGEKWIVVPAPLAPMVENSGRTSARKYGGHIRTYSPHHLCVPAGTPISYELLETEPVGRALACAVATGRLRVEPLDTALLLSEVDLTYKITVAHHDECEQKLGEVLRRASQDCIDVLVLPEHSLPPELLGSARRAIDGAFPRLVVSGLCHHQVDDVLINLAVVVSSNGHVVHEHRKITRANDADRWEIHETGHEMPISPSPLGLVATPICKDLFAPQSRHLLESSGATLVLVPSLSPKTADHENAAGSLRQQNLSTTVVANRWGLPRTKMHPGEASSFALVPGADPEVCHSAWGGPLDISW